jgi:hypothetical protein
MYKLLKIFQTVLVLVITFTFSVIAMDQVKIVTVNGMKIELHILPAEPFFTAEEISIKKVKEGMLKIDGAEPIPIDSNMRPNHHLVVHIYDARTGKAISNAEVNMSFQQLDLKGKPVGQSVKVPIVKMQAIGKGIESTHYGNNIVMPDGSYIIEVVANKKNVSFKVKVSSKGNGQSKKMHMH